MKERLFKKGLVFGIIVLLIGISVIPSINANIDRLPSKSKLVETSIKIHRANSIIPYMVKLSEEESETVDSIFNNLKVSLDSAVTDEEIDECYDEAVESLYELGMFPRMTIEEAKQLVKGDRQNLNGKSQPDNIGNSDENFNCQISGATTETNMHDLAYPILNEILVSIRRICGILDIWRFNFRYYDGEIGNISLGHYYSWVYGGEIYYPAKGWVWTDGSNGIVKWEGKLYGTLEIRLMWSEGPWNEHEKGAYMGIRDFEGLWIWRLLKPGYLLGNAEHVSLSYTPPPFNV